MTEDPVCKTDYNAFQEDRYADNLPRWGDRSYREGQLRPRADRAFLGVRQAEVVAVADENPEGLHEAGERLRVNRLYRDYRRMISEEQLHIVSIGPRWVTDRVAMVEAAAQAGCHIYCEKPFAAGLVDADAMIDRAARPGSRSPSPISSAACRQCKKPSATSSQGSTADCCACTPAPKTTIAAAARS